MTLLSACPSPLTVAIPFVDVATSRALPSPRTGVLPRVECADDPDDSDDDLGEDEDLTTQPLPDEESAFDDFDDDFDDDFEEEEIDPDWDHPEENEPPPPPAKGPSKKK